MEFTKENILGVFGDFRRGQLSFDNLEKEIMDLDDTPEKVVVPEFVADWIELCKEKANLIDCLQGGYRHFNGCESIGKDEDWLFEGDNQDVVARAWLDLSVKHEVMTLEVDKDLLGLPEGDKK